MIEELKAHHPRPPLGLEPEWRWRERRAAQLADAIYRQLTTDGHTPDVQLIAAWADELQGLVPFLRRPPTGGRMQP